MDKKKRFVIYGIATFLILAFFTGIFLLLFYHRLFKGTDALAGTSSILDTVHDESGESMVPTKPRPSSSSVPSSQPVNTSLNPRGVPPPSMAPSSAPIALGSLNIYISTSNNLYLGYSVTTTTFVAQATPQLWTLTILSGTPDSFYGYLVLPPLTVLSLLVGESSSTYEISLWPPSLLTQCFSSPPTAATVYSQPCVFQFIQMTPNNFIIQSASTTIYLLVTSDNVLSSTTDYSSASIFSFSVQDASTTTGPSTYGSASNANCWLGCTGQDVFQPNVSTADGGQTYYCSGNVIPSCSTATFPIPTACNKYQGNSQTACVQAFACTMIQPSSGPCQTSSGGYPFTSFPDLSSAYSAGLPPENSLPQWAKPSTSFKW